MRPLIHLAVVAMFLATPALSSRAAITTFDNVTGTGTPYPGGNPWNVTNLVVGDTANGSMRIGEGSDVIDSGIGVIAARASVTQATVLVTGSGSTWTMAAQLSVGEGGTGLLQILNGGSVSNSIQGLVGANGDGTVAVAGAGSTWTKTGSLSIGTHGQGYLSISSGGLVSNSSSASLGSQADGYGQVDVGSGTGASTWTSGSLSIGSLGTGVVNVYGGGSITNGLATMAASTGTATVTVGGGVGVATWTNSAALTVGSTGTATLNINTGGLVAATALNGGNATSSVNFNGGTLRITSTDSASNTINLQSSGGTIDVPTASTTFTITSSMTGAGGLTKTGGATLALSTANGYLGNTTISGGTLLANNTTGSATGSGAVTVNSGGTLGGTGSVSGAVTVNANGTIAPGTSIESLSTGSVLLAAVSAKLNVELDVDLTPDADLLDVAGTVNLGGGTLNLTLLNAPLTLATPRTYLILRNDSADSVLGTFGAVTGLPSGYLATLNYAYSGTDILGRVGTGNDVAVTLSAVPEVGAWFLVAAAATCAAIGKVRRHAAPPSVA
jgi:fibronectin-binding autotransporter adhesin